MALGINTECTSWPRRNTAISSNIARIVAYIAALGEPPPQLDGFGVLRSDDGNGYLAGALSVRPIEGDGAGRIAAKAQFALFVQPLARPAAYVHRDFSHRF